MVNIVLIVELKSELKADLASMNAKMELIEDRLHEGRFDNIAMTTLN